MAIGVRAGGGRGAAEVGEGAAEGGIMCITRKARHLPIEVRGYNYIKCA